MPNISTLAGADLKALAQELDKLLAEYSTKPSVVFESEESRLAWVFSGPKRRKRAWEQSRPCMFPHCKTLAVTRSHTIPRAALALIAEDGHVLTPKFNEVRMRLEMQRIGINQASTFPGFCSGHEQIFQCFEKKVELQEDSSLHAALQVFRILFQEIVITEYGLASLKQTVEKHRAQVDGWGRRKLERFMRGRGLAPVKEFAISGVGPLARAEQTIADQVAHLERLRSQALEPFLAGFRSGVVRGTLLQHLVPGCLPLALAGHTDFRYMARGASTIDNVLVVMGLHPCSNGSFLMVWTPFENGGAAIDDYLRMYSANASESAGILHMIEAWMLSGSDHWYMTPSAWSSLSASERDSALGAISDVEHGIGNPWPPGALSRILLAWSQAR